MNLYTYMYNLIQNWQLTFYKLNQDIDCHVTCCIEKIFASGPVLLGLSYLKTKYWPLIVLLSDHMTWKLASCQASAIVLKYRMLLRMTQHRLHNEKAGGGAFLANNWNWTLNISNLWNSFRPRLVWSLYPCLYWICSFGMLTVIRARAHSDVPMCNNTSASSSLLTFLQQGSLSLNKSELGSDSGLANHKPAFACPWELLLAPAPHSSLALFCPPPDFPSPIVHWA